MTLHEAIIDALERAERNGLTKPGDISLCIQASLDSAGLIVRRKPDTKNNSDDRRPIPFTVPGV